VEQVTSRAAPTRFNRFWLPGFAFKAFVIGGGYATGRELAEFFLPGGPVGGLLGMALAMACWSLVCVVTFLFARAHNSYDYGAFFRHLLGPAAFVFDIAYAAFMVIILSVFGAAAGEIGRALFGWPELAGTLILVSAIATITTFGNLAVERLFKVVTYFLYAVYIVFVVLAFLKTGNRIFASFHAAQITGSDWVLNGLTYAGYNVIGAVAILPTLRHLTSQRDAVVAGVLAGPLGMLPAILLFLCMCAYYPEIGAATLPSDYLLGRFNVPVFQLVFELMVFSALLESGTGAVHGALQRICGSLAARNVSFPNSLRLTLALCILIVSIFVAARFGLVALIARGYRLLAYLILLVYVVPVLTRGVWLLTRRRPACAQSTHPSL
jgi:uncharacterized membrane protein YkvI